MNLDDVLRSDLIDLEATHLKRELRTLESAQGTKIAIDGRMLLNFSSNDYLGLAWHPRLIAAAEQALKRCGTGAGASRLICGNLDVHEALDAAVARFKGTEAALTFSTGFATALGVLPALVGKGDTIILDKLSHACLVDAARLSGATLRVFPHNNLDYLAKLLEGATGRVLIAVESLYSMDGDFAPLEEIVALKERFGAWLLVDEAHATGVCGEHGRGRVNELGLAGCVEVQMGTLSKALGSAGGFVAGSQALRDFLINRARSFIFSTAPSPVVAAASLAAIEFLETDIGEVARQSLWVNVHRFNDSLPGKWRRDSAQLSPIFPLIIGQADDALAAAKHLCDEDILVPAIRYPTVARNAARLRVTLSAMHSPEQIEKLLSALDF